jgi:hypothetical protein
MYKFTLSGLDRFFNIIKFGLFAWCCKELINKSGIVLLPYEIQSLNNNEPQIIFDSLVVDYDY